MKIKEYKLTAVIGLPGYSNIQPNVTFEGVEDMAEAHREACVFLNKIWEDTPGANILSPLTPTENAVKDIFGQKINFDEATHTYTNDKGQVYLSGSVYAKRFDKEFPADVISKKMADKSGVDQQHILDAWKAKADVSSGFGTAIHLALENYAKYSDLAKTLDKPYDLHDHPVINKCVVDFFKGREKEIALTEALVVDHERRLAGTIDRLLLVDKKKKICRVQDYKTNADIDKKLAVYWHQLSFYASILQAKGWKVEGLDIFHWDGTWHSYESKVLEVTV
jgi:hypothetical protein